MVAPGFLANPQVRQWLNGVEPAWTMLEFDSFNALHDEPSIHNHAIRLEPRLTATEVSASAVSVNTMLLLRRSAEAGGLKLTATGNLSRAVVEGMLGIEWPGYDKAELVQYNKVINEPDFLPLHFIRVLLQTARLLRKSRGTLVPSPVGRRILKGKQYGPLQALLFHVAFWRLNLGYFDRYPIDSWPQNEVGVVLWSLSASGHDWGTRETLARLCASPVIGVLESQWDFGSGAMEARILRPLLWFGLLESRREERLASELVERRLYRKAPLFDRFQKFDVRVEGQDIRH